MFVFTKQDTRPETVELIREYAKRNKRALNAAKTQRDVLMYQHTHNALMEVANIVERAKIDLGEIAKESR